MTLHICGKCNKSKASKLKKELGKRLGKTDRSDIDLKMSGCLGGCKGLTVKLEKQKKISGLKLKDAKKILKMIS